MTDATRPTPDMLLARAAREEGRAGADGRGRLKIFFGMAPGVGKTYAMLAAAQRLAREGVDVVAGVVETHGRSETEQMLLGLDVLRRRSIEYRGTDGTASPVMLSEFDLDAALARKPNVLLIDELAHTNAPGSRHEKRWQDVRTCIAAGIDVFTTLNVQHIESLSDVVGQITGAVVRETIPDSVVEEADEIELVDLPPGSLLERLKAGKVYVPESARAAADSFFRTGNLTALRELALRRTAAWVDARMRDYKDSRGIRAIWAASERVLVAVSPSPTSPSLVRAAKRIAAGLHAELIAAYVETPALSRLPAADRERAMNTLRLAETLGAQTVILTAPDSRGAASELVSLARTRHVNRIIVGKTGRSRAREAWALLTGGGASFVSDVIRAAIDIDVSVIRAESGEPAIDIDTLTRAARSPFQPFPFIASGVIIAIATLTGWTIYAPPDLSDEAMVLLAGIVITALRFGRWPAVLATVLGVLCFNFFFTEPRFTLYVNSASSLVTFLVMLATGIIVATLASRVRSQRERAREREARTSALYSLTRELAAAGTRDAIANAGARHVSETFGADVVIAVPGSIGTITLDVIASAGSPDFFGDEHGNERAVARWAFDHRSPAGNGTRSLPSAAARYIPLASAQGKLGVIGVRLHAASSLLTTEDLLQLDTAANQVALAMERVTLIESGQTARVDAERERLRSALLSSVSHDLRTPLAGIAGAASTLRESGSGLDDDTRAELLDSIVSESERLTGLISNLVFATRLESGHVELRTEWTTVQEIVGVGLTPHRAAIEHRRVSVHLADTLPFVRVDTMMLPQVISNLMENALKYSPSGSPIEISAWTVDTTVVVRIADEGPGLSPDEQSRVFDRFYRGSGARAIGAAGSSARFGLGLGLTICRGIIHAHGGRLWTEPNVPRGAAFLFSLPIEAPPPGPPRESIMETP